MVPAPLRRVRPYLGAAVLLAAVACAIDYASLRWFGPVGAFVHVRWAPEVDAVQREALELRFCLTSREQTDGNTYSYLLVDTSVENIRRLVRHPAVQDTHDLDRSAFAVAGAAERALIGDAAAWQRAEQTAAAARASGAGAAALALLAAFVGLAPRQATRLARMLQATVRAVGRGVYGRIPEVSARGAGLFRIVFGSAVVAVFAPSPPALYGTIITPWLWVTGALFVAGVFTRLSFAAFTIGAVAWSVVYSMESGHHPISSLLVALLCLLPSRWGDAVSLDAWLARRREPTISGRRVVSMRDYGYTVWVPGVVLGIALAAAAASKLQEGGVGWILNGTVKYHFLTDAANAPVDWGVRLAVIPGVAMALSFAAIAVEGLVIVAAVLGPAPLRVAAALAVLPMFAGFWLFQGVFWPAWWVLVLSFAPWHLVGTPRGTAQHADARLTPAAPRWQLAHAILLVAAFGQQVVASTWHLEIPPLVSAYDMYSKTYASPAEYPPTGGSSHWLVGTLANRTTRACRIGDDEVQMFAGRPASEYTGSARQMLASCFGDLREVRTVAVERLRPNVDWSAGRYLGMSRSNVTGPIVLGLGATR